MRSLVYILSFCFFSSCNFETYNNISYDIIIVAGQSNTHAGLTLDRSIDIASNNILQLGRFSIYDHVIIPANEPLQHHTIQDDKNGFALPFAKLYQNKYDENPILIIPCGSGGTSLPNDWHTDSFLYNDLIERVKFVLDKFPNSRMKAFLWHQGEADVGNTNYSNLLDDFIANVRRDLNTNDLPFIVGGMVPFWVSQEDNRIKQQDIIRNTPLRVENTSYADPEIPFLIEKFDNEFDIIHYDSKGQRELGRRYYNAYLNILSN